MKTSESVSILERFRSQVKIIPLFLFELGTRKNLTAAMIQFQGQMHCFPFLKVCYIMKSKVDKCKNQVSISVFKDIKCVNKCYIAAPYTHNYFFFTSIFNSTFLFYSDGWIFLEKYTVLKICLHTLNSMVSSGNLVPVLRKA